MTNNRQIRCSSLPRLSRCPASQVAPLFRVEGDDAAARLGSAVHECLANHVKGCVFKHDDMAITAHKWNVDPEEVERLTWAGIRAWHGLKQYFPAPTVEQELVFGMHGWTLTGHPDVMSVVGSEARVLDYKSGFFDGDHDAQVRGYALLTLLANPSAQTARACVVRLRESTADWSDTWTRQELEAWFLGLTDRLADPEIYRMGSQCSYCPKRNECPPRRNWLVDSACNLITSPMHELMKKDIPYEIGSTAGLLYDRVRLLESCCEAARDAIRVEVAASGGVLPTGDGRELILKQQETRKIDAAPAWPLLLERLGLDRLLGTATIGKGKLETEIKADAPRGQKGASVAELMEQLTERGALVTTTQERLEIRRSQAALESKNGNNETATAAAAGNGN